MKQKFKMLKFFAGLSANNPAHMMPYNPLFFPYQLAMASVANTSKGATPNMADIQRAAELQRQYLLDMIPPQPGQARHNWKTWYVYVDTIAAMRLKAVRWLLLQVVIMLVCFTQRRFGYLLSLVSVDFHWWDFVLHIWYDINLKFWSFDYYSMDVLISTCYKLSKTVFLFYIFVV